ncbi:MAG: hypothetical protein JW939_02015 [Candidatus Thermoplasmatota archaeon]|nr:hypothetical protein [Candidatus Thermoplasmatota archaeon]
MDRPYVIRCPEYGSGEENNLPETVIYRVVTYFSKPDLDGHRKRKKERRTEKDDPVDRYYV